VIETSVAFERTGRLPNGMTDSNRMRIDHVITIGPGDTLQDTTETTITGAAGTKALHSSGTFTINKPREVHNFGGGHAIWIFADGQLTLLRTFISGGRKTEITFRRTNAGLSCNIRAPDARENGTGDIALGGYSGQAYQIISSRQASASCRVTKR
jgi:hypothetical protein